MGIGVVRGFALVTLVSVVSVVFVVSFVSLCLITIYAHIFIDRVGLLLFFEKIILFLPMEVYSINIYKLVN